jgi:hypothetical protein
MGMVNNHVKHSRYEVLTAMTIKITIFWGVSHRRFGGTYCLEREG